MAALCVLPLSARAAFSTQGLITAAGPRLRRQDFKNYPLPDTCGRPFQDVKNFVEFFDSALASMAVSRGPQGKGVDTLFAVSELRVEFQEAFPNLAEESPLDRLIIAQLCEFQKIRAQKVKPGVMDKAFVFSFDDDLHDHLASIAPKLYKDSRELVVQAMAKQTRLKQLEEGYQDKWASVLKARQLGRSKISDIFQ